MGSNSCEPRGEAINSTKRVANENLSKMFSASTSNTRITPEEFVNAAKGFVGLGDEYITGWTLHQNDDEIVSTYIKKEEFITHRDANDKEILYKAEYIIFYNLSYGVPSFSFNMWDSSGKLLTLEEVTELSIMKLSKTDFYSVVSQQEHPVLHRPYLIIHPCHTGTLLAAFKNNSSNLIITFLGLITPLIKMNSPLEYGIFL